MNGYTRRRVLKASSVSIIGAGLAGCSGSSGSDSGGGDQQTETSEETATSEDGGSETTTEAGTTYPEWDPEAPFESLPQLASTLLEAEYAGTPGGFQFGAVQELESMEPRDTPLYGDPPSTRPESSEEWLDPDTLLYAQSPDQAAAAYQDAVQPLIENIEEETGRSVEFFPLDSDSALIEALRSERVHIASIGTGAAPYAVNIGGAIPFATQVTADELFGYRLWFITQADNSEINSAEDLKPSHDIPHTDATSNSGNLAPRALVPDHQQLHGGEGQEAEFSGGHAASIQGVLAGDYDAAPTWSGGVFALENQEQIDASNLKVIFASEPFPLDPSMTHYKLHPDLVEGIKRAHFDYSYEDTAWQEQFGTSKFVPFEYSTHMNTILRIHQTNDVTYELGTL